jgi:hypothetical protein
LQDFDRKQQELEALDLEVHIQERQVLLEQRVRPFRQLPVVQKWLQDVQQVSFRKKFLVLEGPSGLGKTEYAKRLFGQPSVCFEVNMAKNDEFELKTFKPKQHKMIFWDEASPSLVCNQRKLFQCPACWVQLGGSSTGCYSYKVWVNDACMVVSSNRWSEQVQRLPHLDAMWLLANQVLVPVTESMFLQ